MYAAAAAKEAGAAFVMVTGLGPRDADRLALASKFGAGLAVDVAVDDPVAALSNATGLARPAGDRRCRRHPGSSAVALKELRVIGALGVDVSAYRTALDLLTSGRYPVESLPRRCVRLEDAEELLATMAGECDGIPPVHGVLTP